MSAIKERIKNNRCVRHLFYYTRAIIKRKTLLQKAALTVENYNLSFANEQERIAQIKDMVRTNALLGFDFYEYILFHFENKSFSERKAFVADWEHLGYTCALNKYENSMLFDNKWKTYHTFGRYYKRDLIFCAKEGDCAEFVKFVDKHKSFIVKPLDSSCGNGVKIIHAENRDCASLYGQLLEEYQAFIAEELIAQINEMSKFHPASVNTIRMPTIRLDDQTCVVNPFMRIGRSGKCVDNGGAGGILCAIDIDAGRLYAAADEHGNTYTTHPDTGEQIIGFTIPRWKEAKAFVKELADVVPSNRYTGWDIALTENGWVMVEANRRGQFIFQIPSQIGFRDEINGLMKKLHIKY